MQVSSVFINPLLGTAVDMLTFAVSSHVYRDIILFCIWDVEFLLQRYRGFLYILPSEFSEVGKDMNGRRLKKWTPTG